MIDYQSPREGSKSRASLGHRGLPRPSWDETAMRIALEMSYRSTCPRRSVGAVIATPDREILTTGYNGAPRRLPHCTEVGCTLDEGGHCVRASHGEANAIHQAARLGVPVRDATLYVTSRPCVRCALSIIQAGLFSVVYGEEYDSDGLGPTVRKMFLDAQIIYRRFYGTITLKGGVLDPTARV